MFSVNRTKMFLYDRSIDDGIRCVWGYTRSLQLTTWSMTMIIVIFLAMSTLRGHTRLIRDAGIRPNVVCAYPVTALRVAVPPNASFQRRRWHVSEPARLAARHHISKSRPAQGPRQRRPLQSNVGPLCEKFNHETVKWRFYHIVNLYSPTYINNHSFITAIPAMKEIIKNTMIIVSTSIP